MKTLRYIMEAIGLQVLMFVFKVLPLDTASSFGGFLGSAIGTRLAASRKARRQIAAALPDEDADKIVTDMWENLGRIMAEYPHIEKIGRERVTIENYEILAQYFEEDQPCLFFSAHMGNWEIPPASLLLQYDKTVDITYRAPNNPWVDKALYKMRSLGGRITAYPKSRGGAQQMLQALRDKRMLCFLIDQKYNEGLAVPFFGQPAMTNPVFVMMARKYNYPLIPIQIIRTQGAHFRVVIHPPLDLSENRDISEIITDAHSLLEEWISKYPAQWLWLHKRWGSKTLSDQDDIKGKP